MTEARRQQTYDEMFAGTGDEVPELLASKGKEARRARLAENRTTMCIECPRATEDSGSRAEAA